MSTAKSGAALRDEILPQDSFIRRHIGPSDEDAARMLGSLGFSSLEGMTAAAVPEQIRTSKPLDLPAPVAEAEALAELKSIAGRNKIFRSFIGAGYHDCRTPAVILRNVLEDPGWYTQYTPYQAEISQGRLEALLNFQTMIADLTGLETANASMLDEATAAAEAMTMSRAVHGGGRIFFVASDCHPQTIEVVRSRARPLGITVEVGDPFKARFGPEVFGLLLQYPSTDGTLRDLSGVCAAAKEAGVLVTAAADLLSLALLRPPGEFGADIAVGSAQRFGVPLGYGGPHAAYFATRAAYLRQMPGRLVGVSKDPQGRPALRLAVQTREQHIRREKATSNICTSQVLLAIMASLYAVYHGPDGLRDIAFRIHRMAAALGLGLKRLGWELEADCFFDTLRVRGTREALLQVLGGAASMRINLRVFDENSVGVALDETTSAEDLRDLLKVFGRDKTAPSVSELLAEAEEGVPRELLRSSPFLNHPVFHRYRSEKELLRYINRLRAKDLSLTGSMIPLGSCTMKLNAASEMLPVSWPEFSGLHPFAPVEQAGGYRLLFEQLGSWLAEATGFAAVSLQPNAGSQGEYTGLLVIRKYLESRGRGERSICLIPQSAHGTNPASAAMAGLKVVPVACDAAGNIDLADLEAKARAHAGELAVLMATYPSTHGVFEERIKDVCRIVHENGGQVYMDGANLNALVGLCRPAELGADVCHMNLHKTFCIPHGGGGPGMGPIGVASHLVPFLPGHPVVQTGGPGAIGPVSAAPWGSAGILPIPWMYIRMMGPTGLVRATQFAILNANYIARRLEPHFPVLYKGRGGLVAHECILDLRPIKEASGVSVEDVAKRLMDYGFHAPTVSFPVPGTLMIEPTESESLGELDRFCEAMIEIRKEIRDIEEGRISREDNPLKNAPHPAEVATASQWTRPYSREKAVYPLPWVKERKFWPAVGRIDNPYGDRNLVCSCVVPE